LDQAVPDQIDLASIAAQRSATQENQLTRIRGYYQRIQQTAVFAPLAVLVLLVLLFLINQGRPRLRRPAYVLLVAGFILALLGGVVVMATPLAVEQLTSGSDTSAAIEEATKSVIEGFGGDVARLILFAGGGYLVLAIALFVLSFFLHQKSIEEKTPDERTYDPKKGSIKK
jgi:hypothetical protein